MTDVDLLDQYLHHGDESSFRELMTRHGPRVRRVCRRILSGPDDVEDACQATFVLLIEKAPTLRDSSALGNWLHGVAHRVAIQQRRDRIRQQRIKQRRAEFGARATGPTHRWDDSDQVVQEELNRLPEIYRVPIELCLVHGQTHQEAAAHLGWPLGTVKTRVLRGRQKLRDRLTRRGVTAVAWLVWWFWRRSPVEAATNPTARPKPQPTLAKPAADQAPTRAPALASRGKPAPGSAGPGVNRRLWILLVLLVVALVVVHWLLPATAPGIVCE